MEGYRKAIERDPASALAHAGLADAYILLPEFMEMRPMDAMPRARAAAIRALELDDGLAEAHTSLARVRSQETRAHLIDAKQVAKCEPYASRGAGIANAYRSCVSRRPRIGTLGRLSKPAAAGCALSHVLLSITSAASRSRVRLWSRAARFVVLPIALQTRRSTARMLPTKASPVAIPTPTASFVSPPEGAGRRNPP